MMNCICIAYHSSYTGKYELCNSEEPTREKSSCKKRSANGEKLHRRFNGKFFRFSIRRIYNARLQHSCNRAIASIKHLLTYRVVRMKYVRCRRVIDYDDFVQITTDQAQVFDIIAIVENARFSKQARRENTLFV